MNTPDFSKGACVRSDPEMWVLGNPGNEMARGICRGYGDVPPCPLVVECTAWAQRMHLSGHIAGYAENGKVLLVQRPQKRCPICNTWMRADRRACSNPCNQIRMARVRENLGQGTCQRCGTEYTRTRPHHKYCSDACRIVTKQERQRELWKQKKESVHV